MHNTFKYGERGAERGRDGQRMRESERYWLPILANWYGEIWLSILFLLFISSFIALCLAKILDTISIFLNLLRQVLWPNTWSFLENFLYILEKNVYSAVIQRNVVYMSGRSTLSKIFKYSFLLIVSYNFSTTVNQVLKSSIILLLLISSFSPVFYIFRSFSVRCINI